MPELLIPTTFDACTFLHILLQGLKSTVEGAIAKLSSIGGSSSNSGVIVYSHEGKLGKGNFSQHQSYSVKRLGTVKKCKIK
jgi:hypothetical protein